MKTLAIWLALCGCAVAAPQLSLDTDFHNWAGSSPDYGLWLPPQIKLGMPDVTYVRSDIGETSYASGTLGTWTIYHNDDAWIQACHSAGLKVLVTLNQYYIETGYQGGKFWVPDSTGSIPAAKFCAWLTQNEPIDAIDVGNEIQNSWLSSQWGWATTVAQAEQVYVTALNAITAAVHAVNPNVKVIGCDAQGQQVLDMISLHPVCDAIDAHPYSSNGSPESAYEPPYNTDLNGFLSFTSAIKAATTIPIWYTEQAPDSGQLQYQNSVWWARRMALELWSGVQNVFVFQFIDYNSPNGQSLLTYFDVPEQAKWVVSRTFDLLSGMTPDANAPTAASSDPNYRSSDFVGVNFVQGQTSVSVAWLGHQAPAPKGDLGWIGFVPSVAIAQATINAFHTNTGPVTVLAQDLVTGDVWYPSFTQSGNTVSIAGEVSQDAVAYTISPGSTASPTPTPPTVKWTATNTYGAVLTAGTGLTVDAKGSETSGDKIVVTLSDPVNVANVWDNNGDSFSKQADGTWVAVAKGAGWIVTTGVSWSVPENHPTISVSEYP